MSNELTYIISVCLQLSGAEVLISNYWKIPSVSKLASDELEAENDFGDVEEDKTRNDYYEKICKILINRYAFIEIAFGYLFAVFGSLAENTNRIIVMIVVLVASYILYRSTIYYAKLTANKKVMQ